MKIKMPRIIRDPHIGPHPMLNGGCYCLCNACVRHENRFGYCICPRCNQDCTGIGRLGSIQHTMEEQKLGYPKGGKPARRYRIEWR